MTASAHRRSSPAWREFIGSLGGILLILALVLSLLLMAESTWLNRFELFALAGLGAIDLILLVIYFATGQKSHPPGTQSGRFDMTNTTIEKTNATWAEFALTGAVLAVLALTLRLSQFATGVYFWACLTIIGLLLIGHLAIKFKHQHPTVKQLLKTRGKVESGSAGVWLLAAVAVMAFAGSVVDLYYEGTHVDEPGYNSLINFLIEMRLLTVIMLATYAALQLRSRSKHKKLPKKLKAEYSASTGHIMSEHRGV